MRPNYIRVDSLGHLLYAAGFIGLGILGLIFDDYAMNWQPVPPSFPAHDALAYISALLLLLSGLGLMIRRAQVKSGMALTGFLALWLLTLRLPPLAADFFSAVNWLGVAETLELVTGGWILTATLLRVNQGSGMPWLTKSFSLKLAILLFGVSLPLIGLSHFVYAKETAQMIPAWLPLRHELAYLTGAGHVAAGIAILLNILPRLAATMEAGMMGSFVLLLHIPGVIAEPTSRFQWTMLCIATAITGAAVIVAHHFVNRPWLLISRTKSV